MPLGQSLPRRRYADEALPRMGPVRRAFASTMRSTSALVRMKRRGARSTTIPTWAPSRRAQRGQFWNGERAAALDTVNLQDGHDRYDN